MNKEQILREYGLSNNEVSIYLANLMLGSAKANDISKKSNLLRTTTYEILKELTQKGLISCFIKSGVKYFEATDPNKLINILEEKKDKIKLILPELKKLQKSIKEKPEVILFEGKLGLKTILDDIISSSPKEILQLNSAEIFNVLQYYFPNWIKRRVKNKIYTRILQQNTKVIEPYKKRNKEEFRDLRFLPSDFKINTANFIYNNKIAILTMKKEEIIGVIIHNKEIIETQKSLFEYLWTISNS